MAISNFRYREPLYLRRDVDGDGSLFVVDRHYTVEWERDGKVVVYTVGKGRRPNFASIPRVFRSLISVLGRHIEAAVLHDDIVELRLWTSAIAADIFEAAMIAELVPSWKRRVMARAVRLFGPKW